MALDFAELQKRKRPNTSTVDVCLDPDAVDVYNAARQRRDEALRATLADVSDDEAREELEVATKALRKAEKSVEQSFVVFRFRALPGMEYEDLQDAHPPTPDQIKEGRLRGRLYNYNPDTFPQALVAACSDDPKLDISDVAQIWKDPNWSYVERTNLFNAALAANSGRARPELGKESGPTRS